MADAATEFPRGPFVAVPGRGMWNAEGVAGLLDELRWAYAEAGRIAELHIASKERVRRLNAFREHLERAWPSVH